MKKYLIVLASGTGSRFGAKCPKQFIKIRGKMIIEHTLAACDCGLFDAGILVVAKEYVDEMKSLVIANGYDLPLRVVAGGGSRKESCELGVACIDDDEAKVVIHNGVQPFVSKREFEQCLTALDKYWVVTNGSPCVYTILEVDDEGVLTNMPGRSHCFNDLGPECFRLSMLRKVFEIGRRDGSFTNFTGIVRRYNLCNIYVTSGSSRNIKITYPEDVVYAERLLNE